MTPFASVAMLEKLALLKIALCNAPALSSASSARLRARVVRADQQITDDRVLSVAQRRDRHHGRKAAAILADVGQFVNVLDPARSLEHQASKPGVIGVASSTLNALARAITSCGSEISAGVILFITSAAA